MAGARMSKRAAAGIDQAATAPEAPASSGGSNGGTPTREADIVQSPNGRRGDLPRRLPDASYMSPPAPGVVDSVDEALSVFASKLASNIAPQRDITVDSFLRGRPEPELDLVPINLRVPRYVAEAVRLASLTSHMRAQEIVAYALRAYAPLGPSLDLAYRKARGDT